MRSTYSGRTAEEAIDEFDLALLAFDERTLAHLPEPDRKLVERLLRRGERVLEVGRDLLRSGQRETLDDNDG